MDVADEFGATPLLCAARRGATISSLYLSKRGANLKTRDNAGNDALGIALAGGHDQRLLQFVVSQKKNATIAVLHSLQVAKKIKEIRKMHPDFLIQDAF